MKVICLGDSNTYGYDPRSFWGEPLDRPWPKILQEEYEIETVNFGENGREIPHSNYVMEYLLKRIKQECPADLLIILLGSNDILNTPLRGPEKIKKRLDEYLGFLTKRTRNLPILLLAPPAMKGLEPYIDATSEEIPAIYEELAKKYQLAFADCEKWGIETAFDRVHFTQSGHVRFAEYIVRTIQTNY